MSNSRVAKYSKARAEGKTARQALIESCCHNDADGDVCFCGEQCGCPVNIIETAKQVDLPVVQTPKAKATAKKSTKPKAVKVRRGRVEVTVSGTFVYSFWRHNAHVLRTWVEHGFITVQDGVINWSYDETACYTWPSANAYPYRLWKSPEERFASVLGVTEDEVPYFFMNHRQEAAAVSW